jgi:glycosyltransferase involved in cell wall biosynthesis
MEIINSLRKTVRVSSTKKGLISVVIPIYGSFDTRRLILTVESIKNQEGVGVEIIVSEQGTKPKVKTLLDNSVKYIFTKHTPNPDLSDFNPGKIRNLAISNATGEFIYTIDADVIFLDKEFLKKSKALLEGDPKLILFRPFMRRLPIENFEEFYQFFKEKGIQSAIDSLDKSQDYLITTDGVQRELKIVTKDTDEYRKTFTTSMENFKRYLEDPSLKGQEPKIWSENRHCGSNFFRREHFDLVGGYCEEFINWGCEDSDLQWKFKEVFNLEFFPEEDFEVMHLDHNRGYFSPEMWVKNESICSQRKTSGILNSILEDQKKWKNHN